MSAHWYWDWAYGTGGPSTQPALSLRPGLKVPPVLQSPTKAHNPGDPAPFPFPTLKPCQKYQVYIGETLPTPNPQPHYPPLPDSAWQVFEQYEEYLDTTTNPPSWKRVTPLKSWWYWIACERASDCCKGGRGCEVYKFRVELPKKDSSNASEQIKFVQDFKCKCHNPKNP